MCLLEFWLFHSLCNQKKHKIRPNTKEDFFGIWLLFLKLLYYVCIFITTHLHQMKVFFEVPSNDEKRRNVWASSAKRISQEKGSTTSHGFPDGIFDLLVPQAVDDRVEHGSEDCIYDRDQFIIIKWSNGPRSNIYEDRSCVEDDHHCKVRGTGGEGLLLPSGWGNVQDGRYNEGIRNDSGWERKQKDDDG